jgi:hypothetical protein
MACGAKIQGSDCCEGGGGGCTPPTSPETDCGDAFVCLKRMIAIVEFDFPNDPPCLWEYLNGPWAFLPDGGDFWAKVTDGVAFRAVLQRTLCGEGAFSSEGACPFETVEMNLRADCVEAGLLITWSITNATADCELFISQAQVVIELPLLISSGMTYEFTSFAGFPTAVWGRVTFLGTPCEDMSECVDGPTAGFTATPSFTDPGLSYEDLLDGGCDSSFADYAGCRWAIVNTSTAGACDIIACYWSDGSKEGCEREVYVAYTGCGSFEDALTMLVIDSRGCWDTFTVEPLVCCQCCPVTGSVTLEFDEQRPDECLEVEGNIVCGGFLEHCNAYYKFTFGEGSNADCAALSEQFENRVCYIVDWDGLLERDGGTLPTICVPGQQVRVKHDSGADGTTHCVKVTPFDWLGGNECFGEPQYFTFLSLFAFPPGADTSHVPEDCEEYINFYECPPDP